MFDQGKEGAGSVGRAVLHGAGDEPGVKSVESVWSVWAVRRGRGGQHWTDSAGAGEVHGVSCGQGVQHKLLRSKTGAEALRVCAGDGGFFRAVHRSHRRLVHHAVRGDGQRQSNPALHSRQRPAKVWQVSRGVALAAGGYEGPRKQDNRYSRVCGERGRGRRWPRVEECSGGESHFQSAEDVSRIVWIIREARLSRKRRGKLLKTICPHTQEAAPFSAEFHSR